MLLQLEGAEIVGFSEYRTLGEVGKSTLQYITNAWLMRSSQRQKQKPAQVFRAGKSYQGDQSTGGVGNHRGAQFWT